MTHANLEKLGTVSVDPRGVYVHVEGFASQVQDAADRDISVTHVPRTAVQNLGFVDCAH